MNDAVMFFLVYAFATAVIVGIVRVTRPRVETGSASRIDELESWHARYDAELARTGSEPAALLAADGPPPIDFPSVVRAPVEQRPIRSVGASYAVLQASRRYDEAVRMMTEAVRDGSRPYVVLPSEDVTFSYGDVPEFPAASRVPDLTPLHEYADRTRTELERVLEAERRPAGVPIIRYGESVWG